MAIYKSSNSGIPFGNTSSRPTSPSTGQPYFNGELQRLELYTGAQYGWQNIVAETPGVTGYTGNVLETNATNTIIITGTNFLTGATATLVGTDGTEYIATTTTVNNLTSITAVFGSISASKEPYDIKVTNPSNLYGVYYDVLTVNDKPLWSTAAGSLGTFNSGSVSYQLSATDEENNSLTYALVSGSLPTGLSLSSSGLISGTNSGTPGTTYSFTISVSDGSNTVQSRAFSMYVPYPTVTGGTLTSDSTYYYRTFTANSSLVVSNYDLSADVLIIAGGGGGGADLAGGGGAGGVVYLSNQNLTTGTKNITVGGGGASGVLASGNTETYRGLSAATGGNGVNSSFVSTVATGGGGGSGYTGLGDSTRAKVAQSGGSGGGGGGSEPGYTNSAGAASPAGQGYPGGTGSAGNKYGGGGGGGAGGAGSNGSTTTAGTGGSGTNLYSSWLTAITSAMTGISGWSTATSTGYIAGGGGGAMYDAPNLSGTGQGGSGGGGAGGWGNTVHPAGYDGVINTGSGGGGSGYNGSSGISGGAGGSGLVIVRYTKSQVGG